MNVAIDVSPLENSNLLAHRVRGTGFYIESLKSALLRFFPENKYIFFTQRQNGAGYVRGMNLPKDIDLVHYPYFEPFFLTLPIFKNKKTLVTIHDLTPLVFRSNFPVGLKGIIKWQIQKIAIKNSDAIITDSISSKNDIIKHAGIDSSKIHVVYLAASNLFKKIEKSSILGSIRERYNLPERFVLYVGDVTWNKNLPRLIEAIKKINVSLVMVGSALTNEEFDRSNPWNQDILKVLKSTEGDKRILKLGFVNSEDLAAIYNLATVFVMPSLYEGFGLPILEAMSCGCPVVSSKNGSLPEVAGDAAYYVDAYDVDEIASGISEVYFNQKLQKKLSDKGIVQAKKFSWKKTAGETIEVYKQIIL